MSKAGASTSTAAAASPSPSSLPPLGSPNPTDSFVEMLNQEWDVYRDGQTGRIFYHNPTTGASQWKPPRRNKKSSGSYVAQLPRSSKSIFSFGAREISENSRETRREEIRRARHRHDDAGGEQNRDEEEEEEKGDMSSAKGSGRVVRDSIRRSDQSRIPTPIGYLEEYDPASGHIYYREAFTDNVWYTNLDADGRLYFYTKDGRSEWELPEIASRDQVDNVRGNVAGAKSAEPLTVLVCGLLSRRVLHGQQPPMTPGAGATSSSSSAQTPPKKWAVRFAVVSEGFILFFPDELSFRRMHLREEPTSSSRRDSSFSARHESTASPPDLCVDLSKCTLRWLAKTSAGKRRNVLELKSSLLGVEINLHFDQKPTDENDTDYDVTAKWFDALSTLVQTVIDSSVGLAARRKRSPASPAGVFYPIPTPPELDTSSTPRDRQRMWSGQSADNSRMSRMGTPLVISPPTNFVKASPEELREQLLRNAKSQPDLSVLAGISGTNVDYADEVDNRGHRRVRGQRKLNRNGGLSQSFRKMADVVNLRKNHSGGGGGGLAPATRLARTPSRRSQFLSRFFDSRANEADRRQSRDDLVKRGILQKEAVFGNDLQHAPRDVATGMPEFLVRCVDRIEEMAHTEGLYRRNGDAAAVQKLRLDVDKDNYKMFDATDDPMLLASALKLFFRELPDPIICREVKEQLIAIVGADVKNDERIVAKMRDCFDARAATGPPNDFIVAVLAYLMKHLASVAKITENKMDSKNLATVFSPNLVHSATAARRPESILSEIELNNIIVEKMIAHAERIFQ